MFDPPCHPPEEVSRAVLARPGAKRAGRLFSSHLESRVRRFIEVELDEDEDNWVDLPLELDFEEKYEAQSAA